MKSIKEAIPVVVTGVGGGGHGHQILKALLMARTPYRIIPVDMSPFSIGLFEGEEGYVVPPASNPDYIPTLLDICRKFKVKVLFHGSEPELKVLSENREVFEREGIFLPINPPHVINLCMDKWSLIEYLKSKGFTVPETILVDKEKDIPKEISFPVVIKPSVGGGGSNNVFLAQDEDELIFACRFILRQNRKALVQEYIGTPESEYTVGILFTMEGELIGSIALRRHILSAPSNRFKLPNRTGRKELSSILAISSGISQGIIDDFQEIRKVCEEIGVALGARGPINIQCRFVNGIIYPFEINPRFSGTTSIRALMGFNEPDMLIRHYILKEKIIKPVKYKYGTVVRGLEEKWIDPKILVQWVKK